MTRILQVALFAMVLTLGLLGAAGRQPAEAPVTVVATVEETTTTITTTTLPPESTTTTVPSTWHGEPHCDGHACGPEADAPDEVVTCPGLGGNYQARAKQIGGTCPPVEEEDASPCPPDEWRRGDVRIDLAAEADGCGPRVGEW